MADISLQWNSAEVSGAQLTLPLDGDPSEDWRQRFATTVRLLHRGEWGEVKLDGDSVSVAEVSEGTEPKLHHFLEAVVEQANAAQRTQEAAEREEQEQQEDQDEPDQDEPQGPDAAMTSRFRAYAGSQESEPSADSEAESG